MPGRFTGRLAVFAPLLFAALVLAGRFAALFFFAAGLAALFLAAERFAGLLLAAALAAGRFIVDGHPAALQNIRVPMFVVGTERDHVAPWRSVYKIHYLSDTDVTFALTSGGHNAGIVSEPGHRGRRFRIALKRTDDPCLGADEWAAAATPKDGSWWVDWCQWLDRHSSSDRVPPPAMGAAAKGYAPVEEAPGTYVLQR